MHDRRDTEQIESLCALAFSTGPVAQVVLGRDEVIVFANDQGKHLFGLSDRDGGPAAARSRIVLSPFGIAQLYRSGACGSPCGAGQGCRVAAWNEQRESAHEELQSTNKELETTNEEPQSTNDELQTINTELR
ncbi:hypothetical protein ACWCP4_12040 [Nocardia elegans]